ncbi:hypothetical protein NPIL_686261 [Nephila pilipes]|uniref:DUF5641 domain-containing protein n=1 Tax=Nephila pilipes TaxID=299642 RepID=A0A8X6Q7Z5_NEPPI|nr:hypothetical protein NPIL_651401 [Nephila pilipes]GFU11465.1 hypothetical protein NPIL_686261 [Nephila pilipes]
MNLFKTLAFGDIVLLANDCEKRTSWTLIRIMEFIPGKEGRNRIVCVNIQFNELLRPIQKLFNLEIDKPCEPVLHSKCRRKVTFPDKSCYD